MELVRSSSARVFDARRGVRYRRESSAKFEKNQPADTTPERKIAMDEIYLQGLR